MRFITFCMIFVLAGCGSMSRSECEQYARAASDVALNMCVIAIKEISDEATIDE